MAPVDLDVSKMNFILNQGSNEPSSKHPGGLNVALCDGSVRFFANSMDPQLLQKLVIINDGQVIPPF